MFYIIKNIFIKKEIKLLERMTILKCKDNLWEIFKLKNGIILQYLETKKSIIFKKLYDISYERVYKYAKS